MIDVFFSGDPMEQVRGIEPPLSVWRTGVLTTVRHLQIKKEGRGKDVAEDPKFELLIPLPVKKYFRTPGLIELLFRTKERRKKPSLNSSDLLITWN